MPFVVDSEELGAEAVREGVDVGPRFEPIEGWRQLAIVAGLASKECWRGAASLFALRFSVKGSERRNAYSDGRNRADTVAMRALT
jgi:hypothetical protein